MLQTQQLAFAYNNNTSFQFGNIQASKQAPLLVLGSSGKGKTTLLHLLAGILQASSGSVIVNGTHLEKLSKAALDKFRGRYIGIVYQQSHFVKGLTALENVLLAPYVAGLPQHKSELLNLMEQLQIADCAHKRPQAMSQGQRQRLAIARALANHPKLILADEPTAALDDKNADIVINLLQAQAAKNEATLVIVTHDARVKSAFSNTFILQ